MRTARIALLTAGLVQLAFATTRDVSTFGALGDNSHDDTPNINSAISALVAGDTLSFPCGTYKITGGLTPIAISNITVTGPNTSCVTINATGSGNYVVLKMGGTGLSSASNLASDTTSNTFTTVGGGIAALGIVAGDYVLVSDTATQSHGDGSPFISDQQTVKVAGISGNTATIAGDFAITFTVSAGSSVQKITGVTTGGTVQYLTLDATANTGTATRAMEIEFCANTIVQHSTITHFLGTGDSGGLLVDTGYGNTVSDMTITQAGNGGGSGGENSLMLRRQTNALAKDITITNIASQAVFAYGMHETHYSTATNVNVDHGGADGRPFKLQRASYNTINTATVRNGGAGHNGISVTDKSTYNNFNNCVVESNDGKGIALFGDGNPYNTFTNCTSRYNTQAQFAETVNVDGTYLDPHTTVIGGLYCCQRGTAGVTSVVSLFDDYTTITGATITDDNGGAQNGMVVTANNVIIKNNTFSNLPANRDIFVISGKNTSLYCGNTLPNGTNPSVLNVLCPAIGCQ